jgi:hypothetical protein
MPRGAGDPPIATDSDDAYATPVLAALPSLGYADCKRRASGDHRHDASSEGAETECRAWIM